MKSTDAPSKQAVPFGTNGPREAITATTPSGSNQASYDQGFPPITMTLKSAGGLPPKGQDMNQILFEQSSFNRYFAAGGGYVYDSTFSTAVGGYPLSARIPNSTGTGFWFNTVEDNQTNPENSTSALTGWIPMGSYGVTALTGLTSASITLTTLQASKERITLAGTLTANINIVVPAWIKRWEVVNNCTGAFTVTIKTPSGTGVAIAIGRTALVAGDGTNINTAYAPGSLIGNQTFIVNGTYTPTPGTKSIVVEVQAAGGGGGGARAVSSGNASTAGGGAGGGYSRSLITTVPSSAVVTVGVGGAAGSWQAGGTATAGSSGGSSSFGSLLSATGGGGGGSSMTGQYSTAFQITGGVPGVGSNGNILNSRGGGGLPGLVFTSNNATGGGGGNSFFSGGYNNEARETGIAGILGAGGTGCSVNNNPSATAVGGAGGNGIVIVWEYA